MWRLHNLVAAALIVASVDAFSVGPSPFLRTTGRSAGITSAQRMVGPSLARSVTMMAAATAADFASIERCEFQGTSCVYTEAIDGNEVGVVQAAKPLTPQNPFFEVTIEDGGTMSWIGVGIATKGYDGDKQPGWAVASCGYHADDGCIYKAPRMDDRNTE